MICKLIQKFGLFIFWTCIDEDTRNKSIQEHRYTKMNNNHIDNIVKVAENYEEKYFLLVEEIKRINKEQDIKEIKKQLEIVVENIENV